MIKFETSLKARTYECDIYEHVNHAIFLNYCEYARVEFLNALGYDLKMLIDKGFYLPIVKIEIDYKLPVFAGEELLVSVMWINRGNSSATFEQDIIKSLSKRLAAKAFITWVATDLKGRPVPIPEALVNKVFEIYKELPPVKNEKKG